MPTKSKSPLAADLLTGVEEIAEFIGWPARKVQWQITSGRLPVMRIGQGIIARKSELARFFSARGADEHQP
jgi:hypothetical protein